MDSYLWVAIVTIVLFCDLALGLVVGWRLGRSAGRQSEAEISRARLDRTVRSMNELVDVARAVSHQTGNYIAVTKQLGVELSQLSPGACPAAIAGLLESQRSIQAELEQGRSRLSQHVESSQLALSHQKRRRDSSGGSWHIELLESLVRRSSNQSAASPPIEAKTPIPVAAPGTEPTIGPRRERRDAYRVRQIVAPYVDHRIPAPELFEEVECLDISNSGIAFLSDKRPATEMIVITTGEAASPVYRSARIVHVREVDVDGVTRFRVGCEFIGRLSRHLFT